MRGCLAAQSERFTRSSLTIGQDGRVVAIETGGGEEGRDTGLVDGRLERERERRGETEGRKREREGRGKEDIIIRHFTMLYYVIVPVPTPG